MMRKMETMMLATSLLFVDPFDPIEANFSILFSRTAPGLQDFRKNGPMGKIYNTRVALHQSSQLHDLFIQAQVSTINTDCGFLA